MKTSSISLLYPLDRTTTLASFDFITKGIAKVVVLSPCKTLQKSPPSNDILSQSFAFYEKPGPKEEQMVYLS